MDSHQHKIDAGFKAFNDGSGTLGCKQTQKTNLSSPMSNSYGPLISRDCNPNYQTLVSEVNEKPFGFKIQQQLDTNLDLIKQNNVDSKQYEVDGTDKKCNGHRQDLNISEVRAKKPSLTLNLRLRGDFRTTTNGRAANRLQGQDRQAVTHPSSSHARRYLIRLSCDNCRTRYTEPLAVP
ncbi:hypothetical protein J6590_049429 [Homalodisca vitripennis]|nr:hypothetical protein J6590_049429 [Homalodisca vitripennis]